MAHSRGAGGAVLDLQRDAEALRGQDRDEDRLGPGLDRDRRPSPPSAPSRRAPRRRRAAGARASPPPAAAPPPRAPRPRPRGSAMRAIASARPCTVVAKFGAEQPSMPQPGLVGAAHLLEGGAHRPLHRMVDLDVLRPAAEVAVQGEEARVLARAVVVQLAGRLARRAQPVALGRVVGHLRPAAQVGLGEPEVAEPARHPLHVHRRALVRGAGQRQLLGAESPSAAPLSTQRQRLQHLAGRARQDHRLGVAPGGADRAARRRRPPRGRDGATRRCRRARPRPSGTASAIVELLRQILSQYRMQVAEGEPDPRLHRAERQPLGARRSRRGSGPRRRRPSSTRRCSGAQAGERGARAAPRARRRRAPRSRPAAGRAGTAGRAGPAPGGRRGGSGRCGGCARWRRSRSRRRRAPGRSSRRCARPPPSRPGRSRRRRPPRRPPRMAKAFTRPA